MTTISIGALRQKNIKWPKDLVKDYRKSVANIVEPGLT